MGPNNARHVVWPALVFVGGVVIVGGSSGGIDGGGSGDVVTCGP